MAEESKKELIYGAVMQLLKEGKSIDSIKVSEIAERAGIGKGSIYLHFASKDDVILEALKYFLDEWLKPFKAYTVDRTKSLKEIITGFIMLHIQIFNDYSSLFNPQSGFDYISAFNSKTVPGMIEAVQDARLEYLSVLENVLQAGKEKKLLSYINRYSINVTAEAIMVIVKYLGFRDMLAMKDEKRYSTEECMDLTYDMILRVCK